MANSSYLQNLPSYGSSGSGPSSAGSTMSGRLRIDYKMFNELMQLTYSWSKDLRMRAKVFEQTYPCVLKTGVNSYLSEAIQWERRAGEALSAVADAFSEVQFLTSKTEDWVRSAVYDWDNWTEAIDGAGLVHAGASFADQYYEDFAKKTQQDSDDADMLALVMAWIASECPETNAEYQKKVAEEEEQRMLEFLQKHDLPMYQQVLAEKERRRKAEEEAAKAAEEAEKAMDELGEGYDGSDLGGSDVGGSDFGGSDFGGSDWGGSDLGGSGWDGSDWSSEDWGSDLLADNLDTDELLDAGGALDDITRSGLDDALDSGMGAVGDAADLGDGAAGMFGAYGPRIAEMAQRYGVQTGFAIGGAVAAYALREEATEAVAHVAEFVSTKCKPAMTDVMDQVSGAAKQTRVKLDNVRSGMASTLHGEKAGDLDG